MAIISYKYRVQIPVPMDICGNTQLDDGTYLHNTYRTEWVEGREICKDKDVAERVKVLETITEKDYFSGQKYKDIQVINQ